MEHPCAEVDVFSTGPFTGNPLAVIADADGLTTEQMRTIANWTNSSETTFLLQPTDPAADYRVRIFTPHEEFPFAGHPTLGSARAWLAFGGRPKQDGIVFQECGVGLVQVRVDKDRLAFATPPRTNTAPLTDEELAEACAALGIATDDVMAAHWGTNGPLWQLIQLRDAQAVRNVRPDPQRGDLKLGLVGLETEPGETQVEIRGILEDFEDPVTGSLNGAAAQWLRERDLVPEQYVASQGSQIGRRGRVFIDDDGTDIWVGVRADIRVKAPSRPEELGFPEPAVDACSPTLSRARIRPRPTAAGRRRSVRGRR